MADFMSPKQRSNAMSQVRNRNTKPEKLIRSYLHNHGFRFRINNPILPGKPDIILKKYNAIIFIHGCFWHNHKGCKKSKIPDTRYEFWKKKITDTARRDQRNISELSKLGWRIAVVWECRTQKKEVLDQTTKKLSKWLKGNKRQLEI